ncbi:hypothetical protein A0H81_01087 [Grifola frondosa]|uniref:Uncharacterized protein n=1 Tax=Grifola frondosa TaxID=5627 RepID=A0A1C7MU65_GRIFR|nr:hypothetical protein A0H81_01087 [Grifola frondosa]
MTASPKVSPHSPAHRAAHPPRPPQVLLNNRPLPLKHRRCHARRAHWPSTPRTLHSTNWSSNQEHVFCVLWAGLYHITGTDLVRAFIFHFEAFGRPIRNMEFEEGMFSDLHGLKPGVDAFFEEPKVSTPCCRIPHVTIVAYLPPGCGLITGRYVSAFTTLTTPFRFPASQRSPDDFEPTNFRRGITRYSRGTSPTTSKWTPASSSWPRSTASPQARSRSHGCLRRATTSFPSSGPPRSACVLCYLAIAKI